MLPLESTPSSRKVSAMYLATMVLPVPVFPKNIECKYGVTEFMPNFFRSLWSRI